MISKTELDTIFTYSAPTEEHRAKFEALNAKTRELVDMVNELCPDSREKSLTITKLDEARFHMNAAIVRRS